jgi:prepilin-type processing-associated H-X9-DG protein
VANLNDLAAPSETALLADAAQVNDFQAPASPSNPMLEEFYYVNSVEATAHFRHAGSANVLFCDGHVAAESPAPGSLDTRMPEARVGRLAPEYFR